MRRLALIAVATLALLVAACGGATTRTTAPETVIGTIEEPEVELGDPEQGKEVFNSTGCGGCHVLAAAGSAGTVGPDLDQSLQGKDAAYVQQSIVNPDAVLAEGFSAGLMPKDYGQTLSKEQLGDLVAVLVQAAGGEAPPPAPAEPEPPPAPTAPEPAPPPPPAAEGDPELGLEAFNQQGCGGCHVLAAAGSAGTVGPDLDQSLQGKDAAYVEQGILDTDAVLAEGFAAGIMPPNYGDTLSEEQLAGLVALLTPRS